MKAPPTSEARDRVLSDVEIKAFWQAAGERSWPFENVFKLLLLTAARREEVAGMRWREIDLDHSTWTIAKERAKNGRMRSCQYLIVPWHQVGFWFRMRSFSKKPEQSCL
jgi:integrase